MNLVMSLYLVLLFVLLTPGVLLTLPKGGKRLTVAAVHGVVFVLVYYLTYSLVWEFSTSMEGFQTDVEGGSPMVANPECEAAKQARQAAKAERLAANTASVAANTAAKQARQEAVAANTAAKAAHEGVLKANRATNAADRAAEGACNKGKGSTRVGNLLRMFSK